MGFAFSHLWCQLGVSSLYERDPSFLVRFVSWKVVLEGVDGYLPLYFLDSTVREKQNCV